MHLLPDLMYSSRELDTTSPKPIQRYDNDYINIRQRNNVLFSSLFILI